MKRRTFVKNSALAVSAMSILPAMAMSQEKISNAELIGKGSPEFVEKNGYRLRPAAAGAFDKMSAAAQQDGIQFQVVSSYRDYNHQNSIWERKYKAYTAEGDAPEKAIDRIIEYSTIPGTSRHHWGTDVDIVDANGKNNGDLLVPSKFHGNGPYCKFKEWMSKNSEQYGYFLVYTDNFYRKGFKYEPWHYSYAPLSRNYLIDYKKLDVAQVLQEQKLLGSDHFTPQFIEKYRSENILDINPDLLT
tara:strand:- start:536 stop:1270 length:735 start_codon:yes stop_codon:yes gene_type:complete